MPRIHENPLGDDGLEALVSEILNLAATEISSTEGDKQQQQQQQQRVSLSLQALDVGACDMTDAGASSLARLIGANVGLKAISITGNGSVGIDGWMEVGEALGRNDQLDAVELHHNALGDRGTAAVIVGLVHNRTVRCVDLEGNGIGSAGGQRILELMRSRNNVRTVYARNGNNIDENLIDKIEELQADEF